MEVPASCSDKTLLRPAASMPGTQHWGGHPCHAQGFSGDRETLFSLKKLLVLGGLEGSKGCHKVLISGSFQFFL